MAQRVRSRLQGTVDYTANSRETLSLARGLVYRELYLRLQGQLTVSAANNSPSNTLRGDEWAVVDRIELIANGTDVLKSLDANALWWLNLFMYGVAPRVTPTIGDTATLDPSFDVLLILPLWMPRAVRPMDTALDSRELSSLEIAVTWADHLSINGSATAFTVNPSLEVYSLESFGVRGPFATWRIFAIESVIAATSSRHQIQLPVGKAYRGFLINTKDGVLDQSDILNNFRLISGTTVFADLSAGADVLQQIPMLRGAISRGYSGSAYDDYRQGDNNDIDGWYYYDLVTDGFLTEAIDTLGLSELLIEADVTVGAGTTVMTVYPMELIPVRGRGRTRAGR